VLPAETQASAALARAVLFVGLELRDGHAHRRVALRRSATSTGSSIVTTSLAAHHAAARPGSCSQRRLGADEHELGLRVFVEEGATGRQRDRRPVVAAHAVDGQTHRRQRCG
jgi:hypothetical protein